MYLLFVLAWRTAAAQAARARGSGVVIFRLLRGRVSAMDEFLHHKVSLEAEVAVLSFGCPFYAIK